MVHAFIKEIFESIQGEALYIGQKQIFIRFCGCNLCCDYCDTDFSKKENFIVHNFSKEYKNPVSTENLAKITGDFSSDTISLTGGEPLLYADFLKEFLPLVNTKKIYLETNGTLPDNLEKIINYVEVISMDIKLSCATKQENQFENNRKFIEISKRHGKEVFAKIILNKKYDKKELLAAIDILKEFDIPLIIQPMDCKDKSIELEKKSIIELFNFVTQNYQNARLIPQMHKYLNLL